MQSTTDRRAAPIRVSIVWSVDRAMGAVRDEFNEMPGMRLTRAQCRRLWHLTVAQCDHVLHELIDCGFLVEVPTGHLRRKVDGAC
jgi:hypothetical protein